MSIKLKIVLVVLCLIFDICLYQRMLNKKIDYKLGLAWIFVTFGLILSTIFDKLLMKLAYLLGFEILSNMIFLLGFICLSIIILSLCTKVSIQNEKITKLTQELALLKKEQNNEKHH